MNRNVLIVIGFLLIFTISTKLVIAAEGDEQISNQSNDKQQTNNITTDENLTAYKEEQPPVGYVLNIAYYSKDGVSSLIFRVSRPFLAEVKILNYPYRLIIDIPMPYGWKASDVDLKKNIPVTFVQGFRYGTPARNIFRVVGDLGKPVAVNRSYVIKRSEDIYDFVIELRPSENNDTVVISNNLAFSKESQILKNLDTISRLQEEQSRIDQRKYFIEGRIKSYLDTVSYDKPVNNNPNKKIKVFLDPGHGGKDSGASSNDGALLEKNLVLEIANLVKKNLESNEEVSVILSRTQDYYVPLRDRVLWAEYLGATIFVSLHADKSEFNNTSSGMSIYTISEIASDTQAQLLANESNKSDVVAGVVLNKEDEDVNKILISLSQRLKINESNILAKSIVDKANTNLRILPNPVRSAGFAVLKVPNTPSILIEMGFLSNSSDYIGFRSDEYKNIISTSVSDGILSYLWDKSMLTKEPKYFKQQQAVISPTNTTN